jgi:para-aminobenzoate synthetase component 1
LREQQQWLDKTVAVKTGNSFPVYNIHEFRIKMLNWAKQFNIFCLLDNRQYHFEQPGFECLFGVGNRKSISANAGNAFNTLRAFYKDHPGEWVFGHFGRLKRYL